MGGHTQQTVLIFKYKELAGQFNNRKKNVLKKISTDYMLDMSEVINL